MIVLNKQEYPDNGCFQREHIQEYCNLEIYPLVGILEREAGLSFQDIANKLNTELIPTASGGSKWYKSTVRHLYLRNLTK